VGNAKRAAALAIAQQELKAAEMKVAELTRGKIAKSARQTTTSD
jgi:hypothetical protein